MMTDAIATTTNPDVEIFLLRFPETQRPAYRRLLYYAAMPLVVTPELLHYLRNTFVRDAPWVAEADLLLATNLFEEKNFEQYIMQTTVRDHLLRAARQYLGVQNMQDAARLLVHYLYHHLPQLGLPAGELNAQTWAALLYLDEYHDKVVTQIAQTLQALLETTTTAEYAGRATLESMVEVIHQIAPLLTDHLELIDFARMTQSILHEEIDLTALSSERLTQPHEIAGVQLPSLSRILGISRKSQNVIKSIIDREATTNDRVTRSSTVDEISKEATLLTTAGLDAAQIGETEKAHDLFRHALRLWDAIGQKDGEAATFKAQGDAYRLEARDEEAFESYKLALDIYHAMNDLRGEATILSDMALVYTELGRHDEALTLYKQSLVIYQQIGDKLGEANVLNTIARVGAALSKSNENFAYDVFISYSSQDAAWVRGELLTRLEAAGLKVIIDFRDFHIGAPSVMEMERGITTSRKTVLVLTPAYLASAWTEFENLMLQTLDPTNRALRLIPLLKAPCDLPTRIGFLTYVNFTDPAEIDLAWRKLLTSLGAATTSPTTSAHSVTAPPPDTPSPAAIRQLRTILAQLYPDKRSATRLADDAGLPVTMIALDGRPLDRWHAILSEAQKRNRLMTLVERVREEYGTNEELAVAIKSLSLAQANISTSMQPIKILFLAANPHDMSRLDLGKEVRAIDRALRVASFRDQFELLQHWAVRYSDLQDLLSRHQPDIVHFSGHSTSNGELVFEDDNSNGALVGGGELKLLFSQYKGTIRCMLLNAVYTEELAISLAEIIDYVVGVRNEITDDVAILFSTEFYQALGNNNTIPKAFELSKARIGLENLEESYVLCTSERKSPS